MDKSTIDLTGARYGFLQDETPTMEAAKIQDMEAAFRNISCLKHVLDECGQKTTPIYKAEVKGHPEYKVVFFDSGTEKKGDGDRVFYSFGNKVMKRGFSIMFYGTEAKDMNKVGLSFEEALKELLD